MVDEYKNTVENLKMMKKQLVGFNQQVYEKLKDLE